MGPLMVMRMLLAVFNSLSGEYATQGQQAKNQADNK